MLRTDCLFVILVAGFGWLPVCVFGSETQVYRVNAAEVISEAADGQERIAVESRSGFSSLSVGASFIDYEESTRMRIGGREVDVETDLGAIPTQSSNAFISIDRQRGFYLYSVSTLGVPQSSETWEVDDRVIRTNKVSFEQQGIGLLGSYRRGDLGHLLLGAQYLKLEYQRFAARLTPLATEAGVSETDFADGTVSESVWDISLLVGYEKGTLFRGSHRDWQYQWRVTLGLPLVMSLSNTDVDEGEIFRESFNGYEIRLLALAGYRVNARFLVVASLQIGVQQRYALDEASFEDESVTAFPGSRTVSVIPTIGAYWSF